MERFRKTPSRYAVLEEINSSEFRTINEALNGINIKYTLTDHSGLNRARFPWSKDYLRFPEFYASRLWEYPWAIISANLKPGLKCADVGCGESPFTIYLKEIADCDVTGFDPDIHSGENKNNFGASESFIKSTGLDIIQSSIDRIESDDEKFDRVFCISVIEHIKDPAIRAKGVREISRILKPGGLAIITVDVNLMTRLSNPLELVWESGLTFDGEADFTMPEQRLGIFCDGKQPADVFGLVLKKTSSKIYTQYDQNSEKVDAWRAACLRDTFPLPPTLEELIQKDMKLDQKNKKPGFKTLLRIAIKFLLRHYPGTF